MKDLLERSASTGPLLTMSQGFRSESPWDNRRVQAERLKRLHEDPTTTPNAQGVVVIDKTGDRKGGHTTAQVAHQDLGKRGSKRSRFHDQPVSRGACVLSVRGRPLHCGEICCQRQKGSSGSHHAEDRTGTGEASHRGADVFSGEDRGVKRGHSPHPFACMAASRRGDPDVALEAGWRNPEPPGKGMRMTRTIRDGSAQDWWAVESVAGPDEPDKKEGALGATTDPRTLPDLSTWSVVTALPAPL